MNEHAIDTFSRFAAVVHTRRRSLAALGERPWERPSPRPRRLALERRPRKRKSGSRRRAGARTDSARRSSRICVRWMSAKPRSSRRRWRAARS